MNKNNLITPGTVVCRNKELLAGNIDGEVILMSFANNEYYGMNRAGSRIWQLLEKPVAVNDIVNVLLEEFETDRQTCLADVTEFLKMLLSKKLISIVE